MNQKTKNKIKKLGYEGEMQKALSDYCAIFEELYEQGFTESQALGILERAYWAAVSELGA